MTCFDEDNLAYNDDDQAWENMTDEAYSDAVDDDDYEDDEDWGGLEDSLTDAEADAETLASAGYGTDEDYGCFGCGDDW